ncbi:tetratricopeptide repeat protein [Streptomyces sp. NPDC060035]|uniref:caspase, EACC1-associated type n=1 Tax=Streptomyces sp. NPDC060035 TaxID=3347044 RepID=UPI003686A31D
MTPDEAKASRAVLFGVHRYTHFSALDGVRHNVPALAESLTAPGTGGLSESHCHTVPDDAGPGELLDALYEACDAAQHLLLFYYSGHGHLGPRSEGLYLSTSASHPQRTHHSVPYDDIRRLVSRARARHKVVIVDSCFSGGALHMGDSPAPADFSVSGACVLTSAAETQRSLCLPEGSVFTIELTRILREGVSGPLPDGRLGELQPDLTMADVYEALRARLAGRVVDEYPVPQPRMSTRDNGHRIPLSRNRAFTGAAPTAPGRRRPTRTVFAPTPYFTGREGEISALVEAASGPPAICIVHGRGGQGKSELLRATASRMAHLFPAGCLEVDLRGWTPGEQPRAPYEVLEEQLRHLGHRPDEIPQDPTARSEAWRLFLEEHPLLVLLDNVRDAHQIRPLLPGAGAVGTVMVASREELTGVAAGLRIGLAPLPAADCVKVLHRMGVSEKAEGLMLLAEATGGSPLALGAIGTRLLRGASSAAVLASLAASSPSHRLPELERAEHAAFMSAYGALEPALRSLIHHCAWHPGPDFGPDSVAAMAEIPPFLAEVQLTDVEQLLVRHGGRYAFHDVSLEHAREIALLDASPGEAEHSLVRLGAHLLARFRTAEEQLTSGPGGAEASADENARVWLDTHMKELHATAREVPEAWSERAQFLLAVAARDILDGRYGDADQLLRLALESTDVNSPEHATAACGLGDVLSFQGRFTEAMGSYERARAIGEALDDRKGCAQAISGLASVLRQQGRYDEAVVSYRQAMQTYASLDETVGQADASLGLAGVLLARGEYGRAADLYRDVRELCVRSAHHGRRVRADQGLADIHRLRGENAAALALYDEVLSEYTSLGNQLGAANVVRCLGVLHLAMGSTTEAAACFREAETSYRAMGIRRGVSNTVLSRAWVHHALAEYDVATALHREALDLYTSLGDELGMANAMQGLADVYLSTENYLGAARAYEEAHARHSRISDSLGQANDLRGMARTSLEQGFTAEAATSFRAAAEIYGTLGVTHRAVECLRGAVLAEGQAVQPPG